jgi:hypothetical protein
MGYKSELPSSKWSLILFELSCMELSTDQQWNGENCFQERPMVVYFYGILTLSMLRYNVFCYFIVGLFVISIALLFVDLFSLMPYWLVCIIHAEEWIL